MKKYRVHLTEEACGDVEVQAENATEAEEKAMQSATVEWDRRRWIASDGQIRR